MIRGSHIDPIFLDMQMPDLDGIQLIQDIGPSQMPLTIFVTAHNEYAIEAFEANALDYLLKLLSHERFEAALDRAKQRLQEADLSRFGERLLRLGPNGMPRKRYLERLAVKRKTASSGREGQRQRFVI